jgi:hypothetical protein
MYKDDDKRKEKLLIREQLVWESDFIGENSGYYSREFHENDTNGFNVSAFFVPVTWCVYRKMYVSAAVLAVIKLLLFFTGFNFIFNLTPMIFMGLYANSLYKTYVMEELYKVKDCTNDTRYEAFQKRGGTNMLAAAAVLILFVILYFCGFSHFVITVWNNSRVSSFVN